MTSVLKTLRENNAYSQEEIAEKLNISRQTYNKYEKTGNIKDVEIIKKLAEIFDVDYNCIIENKLPLTKTYNVTDKKNENIQSDIRIDIPIENIEKFMQVFLYILKKAGAKPNVGQTVLYKLLYFIDFDYYELYESQLMGLIYIKNKFGPSPVDFAKITKEMADNEKIEIVKTKYFNHEMTKYLPLVEPDLSLLSAKELAHIDKVLEKYSDKTASELSNYSHKDIPWIAAKDREIIEYEAVFYRNSNTSVREYND